ncbi:ribonuclease BN (tRNA processing enzyme) [Rhodobium orientis]|uniref:MBL fold metallo-hydrolase n=1 Tax=Rhodobium orientis TaxID=34017 RepID=A0A327JGV8_9HYPH|nr:MBL fold metallo-hydrolase [Rhodobium orientis]MBB4303928.1 ribonuclease BN (tRNA processing enzyme) [Rhodobium orientis]MBK5951472.1 MBL fold metallo-hydrolase [Rhodobium orientis]RAI24543.1 MBL fold metallo-hydrolase [Rhodobium orientis]
MQFRFVGCGDAFGSGGRFNTCFHVTGDNANFLIDCGATSLVALKRQAVDLNAIRTIFVTHFHADHFGGLPPFILDAQFFSKRTGPLTVVGPPGTEDWLVRALETAFPGSSTVFRKFETRLVELEPKTPADIDGVTVTGCRVSHGNPRGPFFGYRFEVEGRVIAYTGDTEGTDALVDLGRNADLFVAEAYFRDKKVPLHLDLASLEERLDEISPKRLVLTHMSEEMLARRDEVPYECAEDGLVLTL